MDTFVRVTKSPLPSVDSTASLCITSEVTPQGRHAKDKTCFWGVRRPTLHWRRLGFGLFFFFFFGAGSPN